MSQRVNTIEFDIDEKGCFCNGLLCFENGVIKKYVNSQLTGEFSLENIDELCKIINVGCGSLEMKKKNCDVDENIVLCNFSMSCIKEVSEFNKMVNSYIETGETHNVYFENGRCPHCGRPYFQNSKECLFCTKKGNLLKKTFKMFRSYFMAILKITILLILSTVMTIIKPIIQGNLIDKYFTRTDAVSFDVASKGLVNSVLILVGLYLLGMALGTVSSILIAKVGCSFSHDLRCRLFDKVQRMSISSVAKHTNGELIHRISNDTENVMNFFVSEASRLLERFIIFLIVLIVLFVTSYKLTILVVLPIPIAIFLFYKSSDKMHKYNAQLWRSGSKEASVLNDIIRGIRLVKTFGNEEKEIAKYSKVSGSFCKMSIINGRFWALFVEPVSFLIAIGEILVLIIGGKMVIDGELSLGSFVSFNLYLAHLYSPLRWMSGLPRRFSNATTSLVKIFDILDEEIDVENSEKSITEINGGDIVFENVSFGYKSYEPVLKNINVTMQEGKMYGLVGHSGAGKSTMINLIIRLFDPNEGKISVGGINLTDYDQRSFRNKIGVVYQDTYLFSGTIYDNIKYSSENASMEEIINSAKIANAHDFIMRLPDGYNTVIGENGYRLSGGERQRLAIARAVLKDPQILILDEATSALDPETEELIQQALGRLVKGRTTVAIAHRLSTLRHADKLIVIENGEIAEMGTHVDLLRERGIYYDLVMAQKQLTRREK